MLQHVKMSVSKKKKKWPGSQAPAVNDNTHFQESRWGRMHLSALKTNQNREDPEDAWQTMRFPAPTPRDDMRPSSMWQGATWKEAKEGEKA